MSTYVLSEEKKLLKKLLSDLETQLNTSLPEIKEKLNIILLSHKDDDILDFLKAYNQMFYQDLSSCLDNNIAPSMQFGIKNNYFSFLHSIQKEGYCYSLDTLYSFDSISKLLLSCVVMQEIRNQQFSLTTTVHDINPEFTCDASIKSILNFSALLQTEKRIEDLSVEDTIDILKTCKENLIEKKKRKNFYQYSDIGYMILRLVIPSFIERLENLLSRIDNKNLTIHNEEMKENITGGKIGEEYITPDRKGRGILFPGHTGLYGNISGLLELLYQIICTENILNFKEKEILLQQPYADPKVYTKDGTHMIGNNSSLQYMCKIAGVYRKPQGIGNNLFHKIAACDMSERTTDAAIATTGTCGSWGMGDILSINHTPSSYVGGILINPYTYVHTGTYPNDINLISNANFTVNKNGVIIDYSQKLNPYKTLISDYGLLLVLLTEYFKITDYNALQDASLKLKK